MKTSFSVTSLVLSFSSVLAAYALADEDWTVSLVQRQLETGNEHKAVVSAEGQGLSVAPVPEGGSEFLLWAVRQTDEGLEETLVDTEMVGAYLPTGKLEIQTGDPYDGPIPRTRIDQGFTVTYEVAGLLSESGSDVPLAARQVLLDHDVAAYEVETTQTSPLLSGVGTVLEDIYGELLPAENFDQRMVVSNGNRNLVFPGSNIPGTNVFQDAGMETFRLFALPDGEIAQLQLDEAKVQVWPLSQGSIVGIEDEARYTTMPEVTIQLANLYPDSTTWVQIYPGDPNSGNEGITLTESMIVVEDVVPRTTRLVFRELQNQLDAEGRWTLEVLTETPFGIEILDTAFFDVEKETITVRGSFQSLSE